MMAKNPPSIKKLQEALDYMPDTGALVWKIRPLHHFKNLTSQKKWNTRYAGKVAGTFDHEGYVLVGVGGVLMKAHRVVWAISHGSWPSGCIDHINHDRADNRLENLRVVSRSENNRNMAARSAHPGVRWRARTSKWLASIRANGKQVHIGSFATLEEAIAAWERAKDRLGFHPNHCATGIPVHTLTDEARRAA